MKKTTQINGNADMLAGALVNLLSNTNRYTNGGIIKIQWLADDEHYRLTVSDNGSGISPEILPRVFERGVTDGSGKLTIESTTGKGTAVTLMFPILTEEHI